MAFISTVEKSCCAGANVADHAMREKKMTFGFMVLTLARFLDLRKNVEMSHQTLRRQSRVYRSCLHTPPRKRSQHHPSRTKQFPVEKCQSGGLFLVSDSPGSHPKC